MGSLTVLALATPIFGFALAPPLPMGLEAPITAAVGVEVAASADVDGVEGDAGADASSVAPEPVLDPSAAAQTEDDYVQQLRLRAKRAKLHRSLGIMTWASMTVAVAMGTVQYRNLYGFGSELKDTPCVTGDAWPNQSRCWGTPVPHLVMGLVTASLYGATMGLSYTMPDPDGAATGDSKFAKRLRTHKALRWVHLAGMGLQMVLGVLVANPQLMGMDRANDYGTLQTLSTVHLATGYATWGALTAAGALMVF